MRQTIVMGGLVLMFLVAGSARADEPPQPAPAPAPPQAPPEPPQPAPAPPRSNPIEGAPAVRNDGLETAEVIDVRRQGADNVLSARRDLEITSEMAFLTSRGAMAGVPELYFTDVGLWRTSAAMSLSRRWRLSGAVDLLAKQPGTIDGAFWQGASLGAAFSIKPRVAIALGVDAGTMLGDVGYHGGAGLGVQARKRMNEFISWEGKLGASATELFYDGGARSWFGEAAGSGEVQFCWGDCRYRYGATWFSLDLAVPFYHHAAASDALDPRTRLGFTMGSFFNVSTHWDMLVTLAFIDRGDPELPATQLPILDGGFDQVQFGVGLIWHVSLDKCGPDDRDPDCHWERERRFEE